LRELTYQTPIKQDAEIKILEEPIKQKKNEKGEIIEKEHKYITVVDCSRGVAGDYNTITVFDVTDFPYKTVFTFKSNTIKPMALPSVIVPIAKKYNESYLLIERNDIGLSVANSCYFDHEYENIFSTKSGGRLGQILSVGPSKTAALGVQMSRQVKRIGCSNLKALIENNKLINFTEDQIMELYNFVYDGDSYAADSGSHDDLVMNMVLLAWLVNQQYYKDLMDHDIMSEFAIKPEEQYDALGFFVFQDGTEDNKIPTEERYGSIQEFPYL
jgi:hypothetical protein